MPDDNMAKWSERARRGSLAFNIVLAVLLLLFLAAITSYAVMSWSS